MLSVKWRLDHQQGGTEPLAGEYSPSSVYATAPGSIRTTSIRRGEEVEEVLCLILVFLILSTILSTIISTICLTNGLANDFAEPLAERIFND